VWKIKISDILTDLNYDDHIEDKAAAVRATRHKTPGESSEIRMRLLEGYSTLYTSLSVRVSRIGAKL